MMGIKSQWLYENLTKITVDSNLCVLKEIECARFVSELSCHFSNTIPKNIFNRTTDQECLMQRLEEMSVHLVEQFAKYDKYPFTIQRICELCYHPLKYFGVDELGKFVNAMEKCCMVISKWELDVGEDKSESQLLESVSLTPIEWVAKGKKQEKQLQKFLNKIDAIVAVNFGYSDEDEGEEGALDELGVAYDKMDEDSDTLVVEGYGNSDDNIVQYDDDDYDDDDDDDDDDSDYNYDAYDSGEEFLIDSGNLSEGHEIEDNNTTSDDSENEDEENGLFPDRTYLDQNTKESNKESMTEELKLSERSDVEIMSSRKRCKEDVCDSYNAKLDDTDLSSKKSKRLSEN